MAKEAKKASLAIWGGETVLKVIVPDSYDPTTAGLPCPARKSK